MTTSVWIPEQLATAAIFSLSTYFSTKVCNWYILLRTGFEKEASYPVLANCDKCEGPLNLWCVGGPNKDGRTTYEFGWKDKVAFV